MTYVIPSDITGIIFNCFRTEKHTQFSRSWIAGKSGDKCFAFRGKNLNKYLHINQKSTETWLKSCIPFWGIFLTEERGIPCLWWRLIVIIFPPSMSHQCLSVLRTAFAMFPEIPEDYKGKFHIHHSPTVEIPACDFFQTLVWREAILDSTAVSRVSRAFKTVSACKENQERYLVMNKTWYYKEQA